MGGAGGAGVGACGARVEGAAIARRNGISSGAETLVRRRACGTSTVQFRAARLGRIKKDTPRREFGGGPTLQDHHTGPAHWTAPGIGFLRRSLRDASGTGGAVQELAANRKPRRSPTVGEKAEVADANEPLRQNV